MEPDSKDKVLAAAAEEFAEYGLSGARVDRIASRAGVNKAMIYYHFSSKENLYQMVIDGRLTAMADSLSSALSDTESDMEGALVRASRAYHAAFRDHTRFGAIFLHELADGGERLRKSLRRIIFRRGLPEKIERLMIAGIRAGNLRKIDTRQALISFVGMNLFYLMTSPIVSSALEIKDEKKFQDKRPESIVDLFMRGIQKR
jgi:TetR/AcrR family transcriptional regulator